MSSSSSSSIEKRTETLDTIAAVLPLSRRGRLAGILTDEDVETLRHLVNEGMGENTLRALTSDLAYLEAWSMAATGRPLPFPAPEALLLKFVAHHLWRPQQREIEPEHGMPSTVEQVLRSQGFLRVSGPHAPATVRRRLANWSTLTAGAAWKGRFRHRPSNRRSGLRSAPLTDHQAARVPAPSLVISSASCWRPVPARISPLCVIGPS